ncbi:hypothetical protein GF377_03045 [candidate division GN15 bacterium]|nr:hypothetical protein [candidate division GN15 bacterium]
MATRRTRRSVRRATPRRPITRRTTTRRTSKAKAGSPWTREQIAFLRKYYRNNETAWVARQLGRTVYSVRYKASDLNIKKARPSVWRGNTGVTKSTSRRPQSRRPRKAYRATSRRTVRKARRSTSRRTRARRR